MKSRIDMVDENYTDWEFSFGHPSAPFNWTCFKVIKESKSTPYLSLYSDIVLEKRRLKQDENGRSYIVSDDRKDIFKILHFCLCPWLYAK